MASFVGFSNSTIKAPVKNKPHICFRQGWWRVSYVPASARCNVAAFIKAHSFVQQLHDNRFRKDKQ